MSAIQRYDVTGQPGEDPIPVPHGRYVLAADHEAAVADARADAIRECIAAVGRLRPWEYPDRTSISYDAAIAALTALLSKDGA